MLKCIKGSICKIRKKRIVVNWLKTSRFSLSLTLLYSQIASKLKSSMSGRLSQTRKENKAVVAFN